MKYRLDLPDFATTLLRETVAGPFLATLETYVCEGLVPYLVDPAAVQAVEVRLSAPYDDELYQGPRSLVKFYFVLELHLAGARGTLDAQAGIKWCPAEQAFTHQGDLVDLDRRYEIPPVGEPSPRGFPPPPVDVSAASPPGDLVLFAFDTWTESEDATDYRHQVAEALDLPIRKAYACIEEAIASFDLEDLAGVFTAADRQDDFLELEGLVESAYEGALEEGMTKRQAVRVVREEVFFSKALIELFEREDFTF